MITLTLSRWYSKYSLSDFHLNMVDIAWSDSLGNSEGSGSDTAIRYVNWNSGPATIVKGDGFVFDSEGGATAGTVTSISYENIGGGGLLELTGIEWDLAKLDRVGIKKMLKGEEILIDGSVNAPGTMLIDLDHGPFNNSYVTIMGSPGRDYLFAEDFRGNVGRTIYAGDGDDLVRGNKGADKLFGEAGSDYLGGNDGKDLLKGGEGNDRLFGGQQRDKLFGGEGDDTLYGDEGNDTLKGGIGHDVLDGGAGNDKMAGGGGADMFIFSAGNDRITDFSAGNKEKIDLSDVASITRFNDLKNNHTKQDGSDLVITDASGNTLTLNGLEIGDLDKGDFIFG